MTTKIIAGHEIALEAGVRYRASCPMVSTLARTTYPVSIRCITPGAGQPAWVLSTEPEVVIDGLSYDEATELVNAFNNGVTSFEGRVW
jgi:hypothetical protein